MLPVRDSNPWRGFAWTIIALAAVNLVIQFVMTRLGAHGGSVVGMLGLIPARFVGWTALGGHPADLWRFLPLASSMFLHDGWLHVGTNMLYLWIFGRALEDKLGRSSFLGLYVFTGIAAAMGQVVAHPHSNAAMIGASGAIAGILGAYLVYFPRAKVTIAFPFLGIPWVLELRAYLLLPGWFAMQVARGVIDLLASHGDPAVAWWAHSTGFLAGGIAALVARGVEAFERAPRPASQGARTVRPTTPVRRPSLVPTARLSRAPGSPVLRPSFAP